jgi:hypothetical protein
MASMFNGGGVRAGGIPTENTGHRMAGPSAEEMRRLLNILGMAEKPKQQFGGSGHGIYASRVNPVPSNLQMLVGEYLGKPGSSAVGKRR